MMLELDIKVREEGIQSDAYNLLDKIQPGKWSADDISVTTVTGGIYNKVYCVLGYEAAKVQPYIDHLPITTIINNTWASGMASSIATGVKALAPDITAVMIVLVDQWQLTVADFIHHQQLWQNDPLTIVVAQDQSTVGLKNKIGPPVIFPRHYFSELTQLTGKQGARAILHKHQKALLKVPLANAFIDVDTPAQLMMMKKMLGVKPFI